MTPQQIELIRDSWAAVEPTAATDLFYRNLFAAAPALRPLFPDDLSAQGHKLAAAIDLVVANLDDLEEILPVVRGLGQRHVGYGAKPAHYEVVGMALLQTLETGLGDAFTPEACEAWGAAFGLLSSVMIEAANDVAA